jgi:serine protease Do
MNCFISVPLSLLLSFVAAWAPLASGQGAAQRKPDSLADLSASLEALSARVGRSVVQVLTTAFGPIPPSSPEPVGFGKQRGKGSGLIVGGEGYILTNAHVVEGAEQVHVMLAVPPTDSGPGHSILKPRGRTIQATVVGTDAETDLALLKTASPMPRGLDLGDSDALRQGQVVLAFGSPFGLENSVTMGIVSSVARQLRPDDAMIYIQTDATINPGNSGGPLVDTSGRVVGVNTFILSQSGGSEGLGFAVPSNIARNVFDQLRRHGRVRRGHVGAHVQTVTPSLAAGLRLARDWGVVVSDVSPGSPAETARLAVGDLIVAIDGKPMENARQFDVNLYRRAPGDEVTIEVLRGRESLTRRVLVLERPDDPARLAALVTRDGNLIERLGILGLDVDERIAAMLPALRKPAGVVVAATVPGTGPGEGFQSGDLILSLNGAAIPNLASLREAVGKMPRGASVAVQIQRMGRLIFVAFDLD